MDKINRKLWNKSNGGTKRMDIQSTDINRREIGTRERKYLPVLSFLIDLLSIVTLKSMILGVNDEKKEAYEKEARLIMHDIDLIIKQSNIKDYGQFIRAIQINAITNRLIWENESKARQGDRSNDYLLPFTHTINALRMYAGNVVSYQIGDRKDLNENKLNEEVCKERGYNFNNLFDTGSSYIGSKWINLNI